MAISSVLQTIRNAEIDARSLSEFVFKPADAMVSRRLAPSIHTLNYYLRFFDGAVSSATADANEIKQQLLSAQQQAQGTVSYIENTIRDAIDTTVIENSPVSDALVSVDGSLSQRTINKGLESIADLSTINNPKDGLRVYVKSYHAGLHKGGGFFVYDDTKVATNDGGYVLNGWVREGGIHALTLEMFGAYGDGNNDDAVAFNNLGQVLKSEETAIVTGESSKYRINSLVTAYNPVDLKGKLILTITDDTRAEFVVQDPDDRYDKMSLTGVTDIKALSNVLTGLPADSENKYIAILSSSQIARYNGTMMSYYRNHCAQIRRDKGRLQDAANLVMHPRVPYDIPKSGIGEIRIFRPRNRIAVNLGDIFVDNSLMTVYKGLGSAISINRDCVDITFGSYNQDKLDNGYAAQFSINGNGYTITGGSLIHSNGTEGLNSYGIDVGMTSNGTIKGITGTTNWHNVVSRHASNVLVEGCSFKNIDEHMGSNWTIKDCVVTTVSFAGSDLSIIGGTVYETIGMRGDTPIARGRLDVQDVVWRGQFRSMVSSTFELVGDFDYPASFFDEVHISNISVQNKSDTSNVYLYETSMEVWGSTNESLGWAQIEFRAPKNIMVRDVVYTTGGDASKIIAGVVRLCTPRLVTQGTCDINIKDIYFNSTSIDELGQPNNYLNPISLPHSYITSSAVDKGEIHIDSLDKIKGLYNITIQNVDNATIGCDWRYIDVLKIVNCEKTSFNTPSGVTYARVGSFRGYKGRGVVKVQGGSVVRHSGYSPERTIDLKLDMVDVYFYGLPIDPFNTYNAKYVRVINCDGTDEVKALLNLNRLYEKGADIFHMTPAVFTVAKLPASALNGANAFASDALKIGELTGAGTGTQVYYDSGTSSWLRVSDDSPVSN